MSSRNSDIEVLRGIAVIYVVVFHAYGNLITWRTPELNLAFRYFAGWSGVDLFFVISGFVIARSLIPRLETCADKKQYWTTSIAFWVRRYWRLLPSSWLWIGLVLLCCLFFNSSGAFGTFRVNLEGGLAAILQVANFYLAATFGTPGGAGALFHLWSLSLEEQFYLLLPILILVSGRWLPYFLGAAVLLQLASTRSGLYEMMLRTDGILLGVLLAMFSRSEAYRLFEPVFLKKMRLLKFLVLGILLVSLAVMGSEHLDLVSHRVSMITLVSFLLVFIASYDGDYLLQKGPLKNLFMWIGSRSYAIYLIHIPAFCLAREIWFRLGQPASPNFNPAYLDQLVITAGLLILLFSELNYRFVELPLRLKGREIARRIEAGKPGKGQPTNTGEPAPRSAGTTDQA
jgi:peptidoglycan/LPS O-acetylase OafA/YrhL